MKIIQTLGKTAHNLIFDDVYDIAKHYQWRCVNDRGKRRFFAVIGKEYFSLKNILFGVDKNTIVLHKNNNDADFRADAIEILTKSEYKHKHHSEKLPNRNINKLKGTNQWIVVFTKDMRTVYERTFYSKKDALIATDYQSRELYNEPRTDKTDKELLLEYKELLEKYKIFRNDNAMKERQGTKKLGSTSKYVGVFLRTSTQKWCAGIKYKGKYYNCGSYKYEKDAAKAYNKKALELYGEGAKLNNV